MGKQGAARVQTLFWHVGSGALPGRIRKGLVFPPLFASQSHHRIGWSNRDDPPQLLQMGSVAPGLSLILASNHLWIRAFLESLYLYGVMGWDGCSWFFLVPTAHKVPRTLYVVHTNLRST